MASSKVDELNIIKRKISKIKIIGSLGAIFLGLGLYGMFGANGNAFHPLLNDKNIVHGLLFLGAAIELWRLYLLIPLYELKAKLSRETNTWQQH